jgi:CubicO group peptidase (beta-lactamase class C family)
MIGRREFLEAASLGLIAGWPSAARAQDKDKDAATTKRKALKPVAPSIPTVVRADEKVNRVLEPVRKQHKMPGMIGAILKGETLEAIGAVGVRKLGSDEPIRVTDQVHIGSDTKAMTATLLGMLVEEEKLAWSSTIRDIFPDRYKALHPDFQAVTLSQLLTHRAGLPHDGPWWFLGRNRSTTDQRRMLLTGMLKTAPESKPGTKYAYSNVGYALAGLMAEQVTGKPWEQLMRERLFTPLAMATAGFGPPGKPGRLDEPWGHREVDGKIQAVQEDNAPALGPAGTVHTSVPDWAKFAALHLRGAQGKARLLKPATFRTLHTPPPGEQYAGGWFVLDRSWAGGPALMHSGSNTSWYATVWLAPRRDFGTLVATNQGGESAAAACDDATGALIELHTSPTTSPLRKRSGRG